MVTVKNTGSETSHSTVLYDTPEHTTILAHISDCQYGLPTAGVFNLHLLKGHILMAERSAGRIHVLHSKVCMLLQDRRTGISLHKHTYGSFIYLFIYLFTVYALFLLLFTYSPTLQTFPAVALQYLLTPPPCRHSLLQPCSIYLLPHPADIPCCSLAVFTYSPHPADIPCCSLAVFTATLTETSYIKTKNIFKILVQMLKYFRMNFI
jgi:hypothetical protein